MITANPPFIPHPEEDNMVKTGEDDKVPFNYFGWGGHDGEVVTRRIVAGAAKHLSDDGRLLIVTQNVNVGTGKFRAKVRAALAVYHGSRNNPSYSCRRTSSRSPRFQRLGKHQNEYGCL